MGLPTSPGLSNGHNPKCPSSRLNCTGEVVLYTAEAEQTAVAEIRPGRSYICTTAELITKNELRVLDLVSPVDEISPFTDELLSWHLDLRRVAINISAQVAQPISRGEDSEVYSRTQYVATLVRLMKLDGIRFKSSLDVPGGVNLAIFNPGAVRYGITKLVRITKSTVEYETLPTAASAFD